MLLLEMINSKPLKIPLNFMGCEFFAYLFYPSNCFSLFLNFLPNWFEKSNFHLAGKGN